MPARAPRAHDVARRCGPHRSGGRRLVVGALLLSVLVTVPAPATATGVASWSDPSSSGDRCRPAEGPFRPREAALSAPRARVAVVRVPRTRDGEIGTAPVTDRGKRVLAWDPAILPGGGEGTVLLNAHTWPDGSALGNRLLAGLRVGDRLRLRGARGAAACYRVRERTRFRRDRIPAAPTFRSWGPEQVVIIVCSGRRRGPGDWTHRTVWYLDPAPAAGPETGARTVARPH